MDYREVEATREFVGGLTHGADWRGELEALAADEDLDAAFFVGLGAVQDARIFFSDKERQEYDAVEFDEPLVREHDPTTALDLWDLDAA